MKPASITVRSDSALAIAMVAALLETADIVPAHEVATAHEPHLAPSGVRLEVNGVDQWLYLCFDPAPRTIAEALAQGAGGILTLENGPEELTHALTSIAEDGVGYLPVDVLRRMTEGSGAADTAELSTLTDREIEVLKRVARGESNGDIASALGISYHTVRSHIRTLAIKLGTATRSELLAHARQLSQRLNAV